MSNGGMITKKGFRPHQDDRFRFPSSRDWEDQVVCKAQSCVCNVKGYCFAPSKAEIGEDGKCENLTLRKKKFIPGKKNNPNIQGL